MNINFIEWEELANAALSQLGKPYLFGSKPSVADNNPINFDCSGFVRWCYGRIGLVVPEGSQDQFDVTQAVTLPQLGDVGFFENGAGETHHVGMLISTNQVIEARGLEPSLEAQGIKTNQVLLRPREKWEAWHEFVGWRRFKAVMV